MRRVGTHLPCEIRSPKVEGISDVSGKALIQRDDDKEEVVAKRLADT